MLRTAVGKSAAQDDNFVVSWRCKTSILGFRLSVKQASACGTHPGFAG